MSSTEQHNQLIITQVTPRPDYICFTANVKKYLNIVNSNTHALMRSTSDVYMCFAVRYQNDELIKTDALWVYFFEGLCPL
jgi:hypothetical protein